ncbi:MAG: Mfa1 family fimbria major subunit [Alistipes sp.]|nr:Mfa1 family fimbria major subunit [Alistipes sp.]
MKFRSILVAALAALTLAACSKDKDNGDIIDPTDPSSEGGVASLKISFSLPNTISGGVNSRATEEATQAESVINTVSVYVFKPNGDLPSQGDYFSLDDTDFDSGTLNADGTKTYEMVTTPLRTTSGNKKIYVGINLPSALDGAVTNEAALLAKVAEVNGDLLHYTGTTLDDLVMFGITEEFLYDVDTQDNEIDVEMARAMARVITTYDDSKSNISNTGEVTVNFTSGVTLTYQIKGFFVVQDAFRSFLAPNFASDGTAYTLVNTVSFADRGDVVNLYDPDDYISTSTIPPYATIGADPGANNRATLDGFYIGENVTTRDRQLAQYGNTTYAYIQTQVAVNQGAYLNGTVGDPGASIDWSTGNAVAAGTDLIVLNVLSNPSVSNNAQLVGTYLCTPANLTDIVNHLQYLGYTTAELPYYTYWDSYVYFPVFLNANNTNKTGLDKYNIYRNEFINIQIAGINASFDDGFGGYPGDEDNPEVPIDPGTEDPNNPKPWEPEDPIDENDADLTINIIVNPWDYIENETILSR